MSRAHVARSPHRVYRDGYLASDEDSDSDDYGDKSFYLKPSRHDSFFDEDAGPEASTADKHSIATVIRRYYGAATVGDGARACKMLTSTLAQGLGDESDTRKDACAKAMSRFFEQLQSLLKAADVPAMVVIDVRVKHGLATALLGFRTLPVGSITIEREHGSWKLSSLIHTAMGA